MIALASSSLKTTAETSHAIEEDPIAGLKRTQEDYKAAEGRCVVPARSSLHGLS